MRMEMDKKLSELAAGQAIAMGRDPKVGVLKVFSSIEAWTHAFLAKILQTQRVQARGAAAPAPAPSLPHRIRREA